MKGRGSTEPFHRFTFWANHYFGLWGGYLFYKSIIVQENLQNSSCFPSKQGNLQSAILFLLSKAAAIITQTKPYEISTMSIHSVVKLNLSRLSVCLHNAPPQRCQMTSHNVTFMEVISALYHVASSQNRNAAFIWSADMCLILPNK